MKKLALIVNREFKSRIKKKSFLILSILSPFVLAALIMAPIVINKANFEVKRVMVFDETNFIVDVLEKNKGSKNHSYFEAPANLEMYDAIEQYDEIADTVVLHIPKNFIKNTAPAVQLFNKNAPGLYLISNVKNDLYDIRKKLIVYSTVKFNLEKFEKNMNSPVQVVFQGQGLHPQLKFYLSFACALLMCLLILIYGMQVLRSVGEEKSSRIVEIIISSVQPITLLKGKIYGVGLAGLLQFGIISFVTCIILWVANASFDIDTGQLLQEQVMLLDGDGNEIAQENKKEVPIPLINKTITAYIYALTDFLPILLLIVPLLFLGGYFLYASFFAVFGALLNEQSDAQTLIFPVLLPIIISIVIGFNVVNNPDSALAFWSSLFPLTAPVVMAARLPFMNFATDWWQLLLCLLLLGASIKISMYFAARIYQTGILMYGQKPSIKTIWKWFKLSKK